MDKISGSSVIALLSNTMIIQDYLKKKKIKAQFVQLETPFPTVKHAARYLSIKEGQFFQSQLLQGENKRLVMCVSSANANIDFKKVEKLTGIRRLRFADTEVIMKTTGFRAGDIPPFGYSAEIQILVEKDLLQFDFGFCHAGDNTVLLKIKPQEIVRVTDGQLADITLREEDMEDDDDDDNLDDDM